MRYRTGDSDSGYRSPGSSKDDVYSPSSEGYSAPPADNAPPIDSKPNKILLYLGIGAIALVVLLSLYLTGVIRP